MSRSPSRSAARAALVGAVLACAVGATTVAASPPSHTCGYFFKGRQDIIVSHAGPVSCANATSIIKAFWAHTGVKMHGTSEATGYWTIAAWPGWRCEQATGVGVCKRHGATASYTVKGGA